MSRDDDILDALLGDADDPRETGQGPVAPKGEMDDLAEVVAALNALPRRAWDDEGDVPPLPALPALPDAGDPHDEPAGATVIPIRRRRVAPILLRAAAAVVLVCVGIGVGALLFGGDDDAAGPAPGGSPIQLISFGEGGPDAHGEVRTVSRNGGSLTLDVSGLDPSRPGEIYTLWLIDRDDNLLTLGSFLVPAEGATTVTVPLPVELENYAALDVSVEEPHGDTGHSGRSVLRGPVSGA